MIVQGIWHSNIGDYLDAYVTAGSSLRVQVPCGLYVRPQSSVEDGIRNCLTEGGKRGSEGPQCFRS